MVSFTMMEIDEIEPKEHVLILPLCAHAVSVTTQSYMHLAQGVSINRPWDFMIITWNVLQKTD